MMPVVQAPIFSCSTKVSRSLDGGVIKAQSELGVARSVTGWSMKAA